jgi:hypothetical protein
MACQLIWILCTRNVSRMYQNSLGSASSLSGGAVVNLKDRVAAAPLAMD